MSGHSKWHKIRGQKGAADAKRGALFSKLAKAITILAKDGADPAMNFSLRIAIEKAKAANMPKDNIDRAVARGVSGAAGEIMHTVVYEGMGPGGVSFLVEAVTDNTSRTVGHVKTIAMKNGANMEAKVLWQFVHKGVVRATGAEKIEDKDSVELACIEAGADDIGWHEDELVVIGPIAQLQALEKVVRELGFVVAGAELEYIPSQTITPSDEDGNRMMALVEAFEDDDDVTNVFTNIA
jgi:YebC/PmpR family DNA-binding regulatory protein